METSFLWWIACFFLWCTSCILLACYDETRLLWWNFAYCNMYGSMELCATYYVCMDGYICAGYLLCWIYMCWIFMWWIYMCCEIFAVIIVGYKKNRTEKRQCRLFAVRDRRQRPLCRRWQTAKGAHGAHLCFLRDGPFGKFAYRGGRQS